MIVKYGKYNQTSIMYLFIDRYIIGLDNRYKIPVNLLYHGL